jgi:hypothetical protein
VGRSRLSAGAASAATAAAMMRVPVVSMCATPWEFLPCGVVWTTGGRMAKIQRRGPVAVGKESPLNNQVAVRSELSADDTIQ